MKVNRYIVLILLVSGCVGSARQDADDSVAKSYVRIMLDNPHYLESVSFTQLEKKRYTTPLDSSLNYAHVKNDDYKAMHKYVDSENGQRPDIANRNTNDEYNIEHGKLDYYTFIYTFRIDSAGQKRLKRYQFELDSLNNVLKARDITFTNIGKEN
jgi:hypothetical protein